MRKLIIFLMLEIIITGTGKVAGQCDPGKHNTSPISACSGYNPAPLTFTTAPSGGLPPYTYQWLLNEVALPGETTSSYDPPKLTSAGFYRYNCAVTDASGIAAFTMSKPITIYPDPSVALSGGGIACQNEVITLTTEISNGTGLCTHQWFSSFDKVVFVAIPGATQSSFLPETSVAGTQYYRATISPSVGSCNNATSPSVAVIITALPVTSSIYHH